MRTPLGACMWRIHACTPLPSASAMRTMQHARAMQHAHIYTHAHARAHTLYLLPFAHHIRFSLKTQLMELTLNMPTTEGLIVELDGE